MLSEGCDEFVRKPFRQEDILNVLAKHLGVRFIYEGPSNVSVSKSPSRPNLGFNFDGLDDHWISKLYQAAMEANSNKIKVLANQIREQNIELASELIELADNFDHDTILTKIGREMDE